MRKHQTYEAVFRTKIDFCKDTALPNHMYHENVFYDKIADESV